MKKDLINFNDNIKLLSKEVSQYEDDKGNYYIIPTANLLLSCSYLEMEEASYKQALFNREIDKTLEYNKITTTKVKSKYEKTHNEKDKNILTDVEVEVYQVWVVKNNLNVVKSFNNKEEAMKFTSEFNKKVFEDTKLIEV